MFNEFPPGSMFEGETTNLNGNVQVIGMADENDIIGSASEIIKGIMSNILIKWQ